MSHLLPITNSFRIGTMVLCHRLHTLLAWMELLLHILVFWSFLASVLGPIPSSGFWLLSLIASIVTRLYCPTLFRLNGCLLVRFGSSTSFLLSQRRRSSCFIDLRRYIIDIMRGHSHMFSYHCELLLVNHAKYQKLLSSR